MDIDEASAASTWPRFGTSLRITPLPGAFGLSGFFRWHVEKLPRFGTFQQVFIRVDFFRVWRRGPPCPGLTERFLMLAAIPSTGRYNRAHEHECSGEANSAQKGG